MRAYATFVAAIFSSALALFGADFPPESVVALDMRYLSPPQVVPATGQSVAEPIDGGVRLTGQAAPDGNAFTWPLRYSVPVKNYPIINIAYKARGILPNPKSGDTLLQMTMLSPAGQVTPAIILDTSELVQDGQVHVLRKDLGRFAADNAITEIAFSFAAPTTGGTLEISDLRFEQGPSSPAPFLMPRENVEFFVSDANNAPVANAEVRAGLIERANWTTVGRTDANGRVVMQIVRPVRPDGTYPDPVEGMVSADGFVPQYVAPIEFPRTGAQVVKLTPVQMQAQTQNAPIGEEPEQSYVYVPRNNVVYYDTYPNSVYVSGWAWSWWIPPYYCGYRPYYHNHYTYYCRRPGYQYQWHRGLEYGQPVDRRDWHRSDWDRNPWRSPQAPIVRDPRDPRDPRESARMRLGEDVRRGNDPGTGLRDSEAWRRANTPLPPSQSAVSGGQATDPNTYRRSGLVNIDGTRSGTATPPVPAPDRGDRYSRDQQNRSPADVTRGNEPPASVRDSESNRRANPQPPAPPSAVRTPELVPRGPAAPSNPPADRGNRRGDDGSTHVAVPDPAPRPPVREPSPPARDSEPSAPARVDRPVTIRPNPQPAPAPAPAPNPPASPSPDRGDRYRRDGGGQVTNPVPRESPAPSRAEAPSAPARPTPVPTPSAGAERGSRPSEPDAQIEGSIGSRGPAFPSTGTRGRGR